jgi:DNA-binding response OmpR family regulator
MERNPLVLVVEDEPDIRDLVAQQLQRAGFRARTAASGEEGVDLAMRLQPSAVILDIMLPGISGTEVCRRLRLDPRTAGVPILMLSARGEEADKVVGFSVGADDYVTKPFSVRELVMRVQAAVRRGGVTDNGKAAGVLELDFRRRTAWVDDDEVRLDPVEFQLLARLVGSAGRPVAKRDLGDAVDAKLEVLRQKLGAVGQRLVSSPDTITLRAANG